MLGFGVALVVCCIAGMSHMGAIHCLHNELEKAENCFKEALTLYRKAYSTMDHEDISLSEDMCF